MKAANLGVRFVLELCLLAALGVTGWAVAEQPVLRLLLAAALPVAAAFVWGLWISPKAPRRLTDPAKVGLESLLFLVAAGGLALTGAASWGLLLAAAYGLNVALMFRWRQRAH